MRFFAWDPLNDSQATASIFDIDCGIEEDAATAWAEEDERSGEPFKDYVDVLVRPADMSEPPRAFRVHVDYSRDYSVTERPGKEKEPCLSG